MSGGLSAARVNRTQRIALIKFSSYGNLIRSGRRRRWRKPLPCTANRIRGLNACNTRGSDPIGRSQITRKVRAVLERRNFSPMSRALAFNPTALIRLKYLTAAARKFPEAAAGRPFCRTKNVKYTKFKKKIPVNEIKRVCCVCVCVVRKAFCQRENTLFAPPLLYILVRGNPLAL